MSNKFSILALDLHNTIYDEVMEYGLALEAAVDVWREAAHRKNVSLQPDRLYHEISAAHRQLDSDWDEEVWLHLPSLLDAGFTEVEWSLTLENAIKARESTSHRLTVSGAFKGAIEAIHTLKKNGVAVYIITEAVAEAGVKAVNWLGLQDMIDGIYTYPSHREALPLQKARHKYFVPDGESHLKKPHSMLLGQLMLDIAVETGQVPQSTDIHMVFEVVYDMDMALLEFPEHSSLQKDVRARLVVKESAFRPVIEAIRQSLLYVGDSKFKDGIMASNANVAFGFAAYGKKVKPQHQADYEKAKLIMYAATGWDKETLQLTQEAGRSGHIQALQPDFTFEHSLQEAVGLF